MDTRQVSSFDARLRATAITAATAWACASGRPPSPAGPVEPAVEPGPPPAVQAPAPSAPVADTAAGTLLVTETEYQGWKYFAVYCERCHAPDAVGTADSPDLRYSVSPEGGVTADSFRVIVRNGTENKEMKGFDDLLDDQRIDQVYAYLKARSEGRLAAGRPQRASPPR